MTTSESESPASSPDGATPRPIQPQNDKYSPTSSSILQRQPFSVNLRALSLRELVSHSRSNQSTAIHHAKLSIRGSENLEDLALMYDRACDRIMTKLTDEPSGVEYKKATATMVLTERQIEKLQKVSIETAVWVAFIEEFEMWAERFGRVTGQQAYIMVEGYIMLCQDFEKAVKNGIK